MKKNYLVRLLLTCIFMFSFFLIGCGNIPDENGDSDISLVHITDEMIMEKANKLFFNYGLSCSSCVGKGNHLFRAEMNNFSGIKQVYKVKIKPKPFGYDFSDYKFKYYYKVYEGNLKILILQDGEKYSVLTINHLSEYYSDVYLEFTGNYTIVFAGESAKFKFYIDQEV